jgi:hypothetical protein
MKRTATSRPRRTLLTAGLWATSLVVAATGTAFAADKISGFEIKNSSISSIDIKNGTIGYHDLSKAAKRNLDARGPASANSAGGGSQGAPGAKGEPGERGAAGAAASLAGQFNKDNVTITKIGGPFVDNATTAGTLTLGAGTYVVNANALFDRKDNLQGSSPVLQLALRGPVSAANKWGDDYGTAFTAPFPASGNLEQTASSSRVVTLAESTIITVKLFGYNADTSDAGKGNYDADVFVNAVRVS